MSLDQKVSALTARLRSEFWKSWEQVAEPAEWQLYTTIIPSTTKIENQILAGPVPALRKWLGTRQYGQTDSFLYSVKNEVFYTAIQSDLSDVEDDQVGILMSQPAEMVKKARIFPGRQVIKAAAAGDGNNTAQGYTGKCFDGTLLYAASHSFGTGNNLLTYTTADWGSGSSTASNTYKLGAYYFGGSLKPFIWQNRSGPDFETNAGTPQSKEERLIKWWVDLRGQSAYGWWWDAILTNVQGLPNVTEMHDIFRNIRKAFRSFKLPTTVSTEDGEYIHEQVKFSDKNLQMIAHPDLDEVMQQALAQDWVPQSGINVGGTGATTVATKNNFYGFARYITSNLFV